MKITVDNTSVHAMAEQADLFSLREGRCVSDYVSTCWLSASTESYLSVAPTQEYVGN